MGAGLSASGSSNTRTATVERAPSCRATCLPNPGSNSSYGGGCGGARIRRKASARSRRFARTLARRIVAEVEEDVASERPVLVDHAIRARWRRHTRRSPPTRTPLLDVLRERVSRGRAGDGALLPEVIA